MGQSGERNAQAQERSHGRFGPQRLKVVSCLACLRRPDQFVGKKIWPKNVHLVEEDLVLFNPEGHHAVRSSFRKGSTCTKWSVLGL